MMRFLLKWMFFFILFVLVYSCDAPIKKQQEFIENNDNDTIINEFASSFQIINGQSDIQINIINQNLNEIVKTYYIRKDVTEKYNDISNNLNRVVTTSSTHVGMMRKLGVADKIVGVSSFKYMCNPMDESEVKEVGEIGYTANPENFIETNSDLILYAGYDMNDPILEKLKQTNLKTFLIYEWQENHPLGRAEWLKIYGLLFNKQEEATRIFEEIKANYFSLSSKFKDAEKSASMMAGTPVGDVFNAPAGDSYMAQLFHDANIDYVYADTKGIGSLGLSIEEVITKNRTTTYWLNADAIVQNDVLTLNSKFELLESVKNRNLYSYVKLGNCFWEKSPVEPDKILEDLGKIFHPELFEDLELNYYSKIE